MTPTTVRVVCNNTLSIALNGAVGAVKVPHSTSFDAQAVKRQLGIAVTQWDSFMYRMKTLSECKVKSHESMNYFLKVLCQTDNQTDALGLTNERALKKVQALYEGGGRGAELASAKGTAWGLLNAVTEFVDHERRARSQEYRLDSAWFGQGPPSSSVPRPGTATRLVSGFIPAGDVFSTWHRPRPSQTGAFVSGYFPYPPSRFLAGDSHGTCHHPDRATVTTSKSPARPAAGQDPDAQPGRMAGRAQAWHRWLGCRCRRGPQPLPVPASPGG